MRAAKCMLLTSNKTKSYKCMILRAQITYDHEWSPGMFSSFGPSVGALESRKWSSGLFRREHKLVEDKGDVVS